jgi:hypothetical protein
VTDCSFSCRDTERGRAGRATDLVGARDMMSAAAKPAKITLPAEGPEVPRGNLLYSMDRSHLRRTRQLEGRYLLRSNLIRVWGGPILLFI